MREDGEVLNPRGQGSGTQCVWEVLGLRCLPKLSLRVCPSGGSEGRQRAAGSLPAQHGVPGALPALGCPSGAEGGPGGLGHLVSASMAIGPWALLNLLAPPGAKTASSAQPSHELGPGPQELLL